MSCESRPEPKYRGPKIVELDCKALMRHYAKKFYKEISKPGIRNISFIVEREDGVNIQSSHTYDSELSETFLKAAHSVRGF
jgi:hypothetical protein